MESTEISDVLPARCCDPNNEVHEDASFAVVENDNMIDGRVALYVEYEGGEGKTTVVVDRDELLEKL